MAIAPGARERTGNVDEGVVGRNAPIVPHAVDLPVWKTQILDSRVVMEALDADTEEHVLPVVEADPPARVHVGSLGVGAGVGGPDRLLVDPPPVLDAPPHELVHRGVAVAAAIAEVQIDPAVLFVVGMEGHFHHPSRAHDQLELLQAIVVGWRRALDQLRLLAVRGDDTQAARLFGQ